MSSCGQELPSPQMTTTNGPLIASIELVDEVEGRVGTEGEPLDGRRDTGRVEGCGEAGGAVGGGAGGWRDGVQVLQGGGGAAIVGRRARGARPTM